MQVITPAGGGGGGGSGTVTSVGLVAAEFANIFTISGTPVTIAGNIGLVAVDPGADRILFWDDSASAYAYLTAGSGLSIVGTTMTATSGSGDVVGPASSVNNRIAAFDLATGKLIKDSGVLYTDVVTGPASVTDQRVAAFNGTTGKLIQQGTQLVADLVSGPASAVTARIATFNGTTGKIIQDSGTLISGLQAASTALSQLAGLGDPGVDAMVFWDASASSYAYLTPGTNLSIAGTVLNASGGGGVAWGAITGTLSSQVDLQAAFDLKVTGPAGAITDGRVVVFDGTTGELVKQGTQLATDLVTGPASVVTARIATYNGTTGKIIQEGSVTIADLQAADALKIAGPGVVTSGRTVVFSGTTGLVVAQSTRLEADLVAGPASSTASRVAVWNGTGGKTLQDGTKLEADLVTGPASVTDQRVAAFNGTTGKVIQQGTQLVADLVSGPASAVTARVATFNGTTGKIIQDGGVLLADLAPLASPALTGNPTAPTPSALDNDTSIATTAFVQGERQPRNQTTASTATLTPVGTAASCDDICTVTALAAAMQIANPSGTSVQGQGLVVRIKDNGTARALTYGSEFRAMGTALPSTTVINKTMYLGFIRNTTDTKWDLVSVAQEA